MWSLALLVFVPSAWSCTTDSRATVVGFDDTRTQALVRIETISFGGDEDRPPDELDLVVLDLASGREVKRFEILNIEDEGDPAVRRANWKAAEAAVVAMGLRVDPSIAPLPQTGNGRLPSVTLPDPASALRFMHVISSYDVPDSTDVVQDLVAEVTRDGVRVRTQVLASFPKEGAVYGVYAVNAVYAVPGGERVVIVTSRCDDEPALLHVVRIVP